MQISPCEILADVLATSLPFPCCTFPLLHFFIIEKYWKGTKDRKQNQKMTLHSALWTCFTFILISYNTFLSLHSFEWLINWKWTNSIFCWKILCLRKNMRGISDGYPENFIDRCFELFLKRIHILRVKKPLRLVLPYLGTISLQTMAKL